MSHPGPPWQPPQHVNPPAPHQGYPHQPYPHQPYAQQAYPQQPYGQYPQPYPQQGHPQGPSGPLTLPGWGTLPVAAGVIATVVGMFALPWGGDVYFTDLRDVASVSGDGFAGHYLNWLGFVALAVLPIGLLPWTLGAARTTKSTGVVTGNWGRRLTGVSFWWYRTTFVLRGLIAGIIHLVGLITLTDGELDALAAGPWVLLSGCVLAAIGGGIGPRKGPGLPRE
ncbi:hypothetical protein ABZ639_29785 [Saccharomonospora sp. NPDC006951]